MADAILIRIVAGNYSDRDWCEYTDWAQAQGSEKVRAELARIRRQNRI